MNTVTHPMSHYETGATPESVAAAKAACEAERAQAKQESGLELAADGTAISIRPAAVIAFDRQQRQADALFAAPSSLPAFHALQLRESQDRDQLADALLVVAGLESDGDARTKARYAATHALRSLSPRWAKAAEDRAIEAAVVAMRTEGGAALRHLPMAHLDALARLLVGVILTSHRALLDGSATLAPAAYLRISTSASGQVTSWNASER